MIELARRRFLHLSLVGVAGAATGLSGCSLPQTPWYGDPEQCATALAAILEEAGSDDFALLNLTRSQLVVRTIDGDTFRTSGDAVEAVSSGNSYSDIYQPTAGSAVDWERLCEAAGRVVDEHDLAPKSVSVTAETKKGGPLRYEVGELGGTRYALTPDFAVRPTVSLTEEDGLRTVIEELAAEMDTPVTTVAIHFNSGTFDVSHGTSFMSRKEDGTITDSDAGVPNEQAFPLLAVDPAVIVGLRTNQDLCIIGTSARHGRPVIRFSGAADEYTLTGERLD